MILVTGGAGYVGSHFVLSYLSRNPQAEVVVVDNFVEGHKEALPASDRVRLVPEDIGDQEAMRTVIAQFPITAVVHFAAFCYVGESQQKPTKYFHNNVVNTMKLLSVMEELGVKKFVFSSSCATYGNPVSLPIDESHAQNPINVYGTTKLMTEQALRSMALAAGWSFVALRYFNAAGADDSGRIGESHDPETHIIPLALQTAAGTREFVRLYGDDYDTPDGTCIRDYIHVNDLAIAHCQALERVHSQQAQDAINLGTTNGASVKEIIAICAEVTGKQIPVQISPRRAGDPPVLVAANERANSILGWKPTYDLRRTIETAWKWEQNRRF